MPRISVGLVNWKISSSTALGASAGGGFLICKAGGVGFIVAPPSTEVSRSWPSREDANTTAQAASGFSGWFVPTVGQLQNPGYLCRSFWGPSPCYSSVYWSSTAAAPFAFTFVHFNSGNASNVGGPSANPVRAFRCVTY